MALTSGPVLVPFFRGNLLNNASRGGMNGWTPVSKKLNGQGLRMKNYFNWPEFSPVSGELLLHLLVAPPPNAIKDTKNCLTWLRERV